MQNLVEYVFAAMLAWIPVHNLTQYGETEVEAKARMRSIAEDVVSVALDANEPPSFKQADGRVKTALLQVAIASMETGYQKFVDDGSCNQVGYHADRRGDCDGRHAFSMWQIHVAGNGYILLEDGTLTSAMYASPEIKASHTIIRGPELLADRKTAIRVAQRIERDSLHQHHSLCAYSGESCDEDRHPKAKARLDRAMDYYQKHPYTDLEVHTSRLGPTERSDEGTIPEPIVTASVTPSANLSSMTITTIAATITNQ
jgi:hypothetical protein